MAFDEYCDREELMSAILEKAATDQDFRDELLEAPKPVIYEELGIQIPASYRIQFVERDPSLDALVVLPDFREDASDEELSDEDLECVAGGTGGTGGSDDPGW